MAGGARRSQATHCEAAATNCELREAHRRGQHSAENLERLWREQAEHWRCIKQLLDLGIRITTASGIDSRQHNFEVIASVVGAAAEHDISTHRGLRFTRRRDPRDGLRHGFPPPETPWCECWRRPYSSLARPRGHRNHRPSHFVRSARPTLAAVIVPVTVPPLAGHAGVPAGPLLRFVQKNTITPPATCTLPKWICDCVTGALKLEKMSV
jgi:hypothetical protein